MTPLISWDHRLKSNTLAGRCLAEGIDLHMQLKEAAWNVKQTQYTSMHELFDEIAWEVACYTDMVAERIIQLGGIARGTVRAAAIRSRLQEFPDTTGSRDYVEAAARALAEFCDHTREGAREAWNLGDVRTTNLFIDISHGVERRLWHFQGRAEFPESTCCNGDVQPAVLSQSGVANQPLLKPLTADPHPGIITDDAFILNCGEELPAPAEPGGKKLFSVASSCCMDLPARNPYLGWGIND